MTPSVHHAMLFARRTILLGLVILLLLPQWAGQGQTPPVISFGETQVTNDFPHGVTLMVSVQSGAGALETATLTYSLEDYSSTVEPIELPAGQQQVELQFVDDELHSPFVTLTYTWQVTDHAGNSATAEGEVFLADPAYTWQSQSGEGFTMYWHDQPADFAGEVFARAEGAFQTAAQLMGSLAQPVKVVLYRPEDPVEQWMPEYALSDGFGYFFDESVLYFLVQGEKPPDGWLDYTLPYWISSFHYVKASHHPLLLELPAWVDEGIAQYVSLDASADKLTWSNTLARCSDSDTALSGVMDPLWWWDDTPEAQVFRAKSLSLVAYLVDTYGAPSLVALVEANQTGKGNAEAFQVAFGKSEEQLEEEWQSWLSGINIVCAPAESVVRLGEVVIENNFPNGVAFRLPIEQGADQIQSASLTITPLGAVPYVQPLDVVEAAKTFELVYHWDAGFPPFSPLEYSFKVVDTQGQQVGLSGDFIYIDPRFEWQSMESPEFTLWWHDQPANFGPVLFALVDEVMEKNKAIFHFDSPNPFQVVIYNNFAEASYSSGEGMQFTAGWSYSAPDVIVTFVDANDPNRNWLNGIIPFHATYLYVSSAAYNPLASTPEWLREGLSNYHMQLDFSTDLIALHDRINTGDYIPLASLRVGWKSDPDWVAQAYTESLSLITFIVERYGPETLGDVAASIRDGKSGDELYQAVFNLSEAELEAEWVEWVRSDPVVGHFDVQETSDPSIASTDEPVTTETNPAVWTNARWVALVAVGLLCGMGLVLIIGLVITFLVIRSRNKQTPA